MKYQNNNTAIQDIECAKFESWAHTASGINWRKCFIPDSIGSSGGVPRRNNKYSRKERLANRSYER